MDKFYVIKIINRGGQRGYLVDSPKGIMIADGITGEITQFKTSEEAQKFIRDRKIERGGIKAYIRDNDDLMKEEAKSLTTLSVDAFYIENEDGEKVFFDGKHQGYYFDKSDVGYCLWKTEEDAKTVIVHFKFTDSSVKKLYPKPKLN